MKNHLKWSAAILGLGALGVGVGCEVPEGDVENPTLSALMDDGDASAVAPGAMARPAPIPPPPRFCAGADCARSPLAFWKLDDCNPNTTALEDTAFSGPFPHPAFRAVSVACVPGVIGQALRLDGDDDIMYAPDQPDFVFGNGLTVAAWINPDKLTGTQSLVRKRFDGTSAFLLAIDGKKLHFVLRLANGRLVDVSAPVQARRFTHVAATFDGQQAILYLDGAAAARARAAGTIAAGVGPIFVGNDANGRRFDGVIDEVWLNTLAAPPDVVSGLTCVRKAPRVAFTPAVSAPQIAGATVPFDLAVTNQSTASCPVDTFEFFAAQVFSPLTADQFVGDVFAGPGQTAHATINIKSSRMAAAGSYPFSYEVADEAGFDAPVLAQATYVVGTGPVACDGFPPSTAAIIGQPFSPATGPAFTFAAPGLAAPSVTSVTTPDGFLQSLQVSAAPGVPADPGSSFLGFGLGFGNPGCVDASRYVGVRFTVTGNLGTCSPTFSVITSENNATRNGIFGTCATDPCIPPRSGPITTGINVVRFADMTGGLPLDTVDATALNGVVWNLTAPSDGVTAPCVADFTISDVTFVTDPNVHQVSYTFDTDIQGWQFNQFNGPPFTNIAVTVPPGGRPPFLAFDPMSGDPAPGSLVVSAPFTAVDQNVDAIASLPFPGVDLSGKTLHARVRLVAGTFAQGGVQFHALSGPSFVFAGTFLNPDQFPLGVWVPMDLDLAAAAASTPGFDPTQIIQIGVQILSGFSSNGDVFTGGDAVFEIDTVTD